MDKEITINKKKIAFDSEAYIIAEMSANHLMDYNRAVAIMEAAKEAGADAIKLQTYTPDTITIDCNNEYFQIKQGTIWDGTTFYKLYKEAYTPWEWQPKLMERAKQIGIDCFSSPFDKTAVDFMESMNMPAYKIASFEIKDVQLIERAAATGKPVIISTGIATADDIELALETCRKAGNSQVILLKCTTAYPAPFEGMNLELISDMSKRFDCITGLSDHSLGDEVAIAGTAIGAKVIEKHLTLSRLDGGPDGKFSMEPEEFRQMVCKIRNVEKAIGKADYSLTDKQKASRLHARSLFVVKDIKAGELLTEENVRSIRPGYGLHTKYLPDVIGKRAKHDIKRGTPLDWGIIEPVGE